MRKLLRKIKRSIDNWCARMERSNKESFGGAALDCCKINQRRPDQRR